MHILVEHHCHRRSRVRFAVAFDQRLRHVPCPFERLRHFAVVRCPDRVREIVGSPLHHFEPAPVGAHESLAHGFEGFDREHVADGQKCLAHPTSARSSLVLGISNPPESVSVLSPSSGTAESGCSSSSTGLSVMSPRICFTRFSIPGLTMRFGFDSTIRRTVAVARSTGRSGASCSSNPLTLRRASSLIAPFSCRLNASADRLGRVTRWSTSYVIT